MKCPFERVPVFLVTFLHFREGELFWGHHESYLAVLPIRAWSRRPQVGFTQQGFFGVEPSGAAPPRFGKYPIIHRVKQPSKRWLFGILSNSSSPEFTKIEPIFLLDNLNNTFKWFVIWIVNGKCQCLHGK